MTITQHQIDQLVDGQRAVLISDTGEFEPLIGKIRNTSSGIQLVPGGGIGFRWITFRGEPFRTDKRSLFVEPPKPPSIYANVERAEPVRGDVVHASGDEGQDEVTVVNRGPSDWMILQTDANFWGTPPGTLTLLVDGTTGKLVQS